MRPRLLAIYGDIERRTEATTAEHAWWPCRRGCDSCCRRLADVPRMVEAEWLLLEEGLRALPASIREHVHDRIEALAVAERDKQLPRHITCPMLDEEAGACRVYEQRPAACRTYGFYVERGLGLHCEQITVAVEDAATREEHVVWGNQEGVDAALSRLRVRDVREGARADQLIVERSVPLTEWARASSWSSGSRGGEGDLPSSPSSAM